MTVKLLAKLSISLSPSTACVPLELVYGTAAGSPMHHCAGNRNCIALTHAQLASSYISAVGLTCKANARINALCGKQKASLQIPYAWKCLRQILSNAIGHNASGGRVRSIDFMQRTVSERERRSARP